MAPKPLDYARPDEPDRGKLKPWQVIAFVLFILVLLAMIAAYLVPGLIQIKRDLDLGIWP